MAPSSGTIPRLDELIKPFLLEGRSEWHTFLLLATLAVVVGVALEVWEIFHNVREEIDHNRGIARTRLLTLSGEGIPVIEHRHTWIKTLGAVGWIFVVLGVAGEFEFDSIISDFDNGIRLIDDSLLRQARSESTDANSASDIDLAQDTTTWATCSPKKQFCHRGWDGSGCSMRHFSEPCLVKSAHAVGMPTLGGWGCCFHRGVSDERRQNRRLAIPQTTRERQRRVAT